MAEVSLVQFPLSDFHWTFTDAVNIGSGNGLVPKGNKPLPEPVLTQNYVVKSRH